MPKGKQRDPNKPKRALTGFMFYSKQRRAEVQRESPELKFADVGRQLGDEWKRMSKAAKQPYEDLAITDKERYKDAMGECAARNGAARRGVARRGAARGARRGAARATFAAWLVFAGLDH
jgi:hypothetical protein